MLDEQVVTATLRTALEAQDFRRMLRAFLTGELGFPPSALTVTVGDWRTDVGSADASGRYPVQLEGNLHYLMKGSVGGPASSPGAVALDHEGATAFVLRAMLLANGSALEDVEVELPELNPAIEADEAAFESLLRELEARLEADAPEAEVIASPGDFGRFTQLLADVLDAEVEIDFPRLARFEEKVVEVLERMYERSDPPREAIDVLCDLADVLLHAFPTR